MKNTSDKNETQFTPIDIKAWKRGEQFYYFSEMAPTGYSITAELDVTHFRKVVKESGRKFFPAYLWLVTKTLCLQDEFKIAVKDGQLGKYETLTPLYAVFHEDDKTFSLIWTEYSDDFSAFYDEYVKNQQEYGNNHGILAQKDKLPPPNAYTVSCIPWMSFSHFAVHSYENKAYYFPSVEAGKFRVNAGKAYMPLSMTCHHAATDGYHVGCFLETLQGYMNSFEQFIYFG